MGQDEIGSSVKHATSPFECLAALSPPEIFSPLPPGITWIVDPLPGSNESTARLAALRGRSSAAAAALTPSAASAEAQPSLNRHAHHAQALVGVHMDGSLIWALKYPA